MNRFRRLLPIGPGTVAVSGQLKQTRQHGERRRYMGRTRRDCHRGQPDDRRVVIFERGRLVRVRRDVTMGGARSVMGVCFVHVLGREHRRDEQRQRRAETRRDTEEAEHGQIMAV